MARLSLEFTGFNEVKKQLESLNADVKAVTEEALIKSHAIVTEKVEKAIATSNLPAGGKYSTGRMANSLRKTANVKWKGTEAEVPVGFDIKKGGLPSIFMMYGTPRYMKVQALYDAFFGEQTEGEVANAQKEIFYKALERIEG